MEIMTTLAAISGDQVINSIIWIVVAGLIAFLVWWFIDYAKLPEPFNKVAKVLVALVVVIVLIKVLLGLAGGLPPLK